LGMYSKMLSENSFDRDIYVKDDESCYSLYTLTDEYIYCVEYSYQGEPGQDSLIDQLSFEAYGEFSGDDDTETLMSYALVHLADLMGDATGYTLAYKEKSTVNGREMAVFKVCSGDDAICLMAVNADGVCYVDYSATGSEFINIELLLYDTTENTSDKLMYYANYYYEVLYGTKPAEGSIVLDNADHYFGDRHLTVYTASCDLETVLIGISDEGIGFVDRSGTGNEFVKIEN